MSISYGLKNKNIVISGGTSGIGLAVAKELIKETTNVFILGRSSGRGKIALEVLGKGYYVSCDVTSETSCKEAIKKVLEKVDRIDILINSAGIYKEERLETITEADFDLTMKVNVLGTMFLSKVCLPYMMTGEDSNIVNVGSDAGVEGNYGCIVYCASKGAVVSLTKAMALDYSPKVRVNCICPADVETPLVEKQLASGSYTLEEMGEVYPLGRIAKASEVAHVILSVVSPHNSFMTGSIINVDGGLTAK